MIAIAATAAHSAPAASKAIPIQSTASSSAPMLISAETPRLASAFITTARQSPSFGFHSSVCSPDPVADAAQNVSEPRGHAYHSYMLREPHRLRVGLVLSLILIFAGIVTDSLLSASWALDDGLLLAAAAVIALALLLTRGRGEA